MKRSETKGACDPMPTERTTDSEAVQCEVRVEARPETVFPFLTDPERMTRWMGDTATLDPRPGGVFRVRVIADDGEGRSHTARGEYLEIDPPSRVVFTWGWEEGDSPVGPGTSTVAIELLPDGDATLVRLTHRDLPADAGEPHRMGWDHYFGRLAIVAAGGDPGPDHGPRRAPAVGGAPIR